VTFVSLCNCGYNFFGWVCMAPEIGSAGAFQGRITTEAQRTGRGL
jgi:hypothetical protein